LIGTLWQRVLFKGWQEQHHQVVAVSTGRPEESWS